MSDEETPVTKPDKKQKNFVKLEDVAQIAEGITSWDKAAFRVYGPKGGTRLVVPKTQKIGRAFFYGSPVPEHRSIKVHDDTTKKSRRLGGITAEIDFSSGSDDALEAIKLLAAAVRSAPAPTKGTVQKKTDDEDAE